MKLVELTANKASFTRIKFQPGLNVVLAERTLDSSDQDSRNGVGKTTLLEIIHFCLGSNLAAGQTLHKVEGDDWAFYLTVDIGGEELTIGRSVDDRTKIFVASPKAETRQLQLAAFKTWLGHRLFGLTGQEATTYTPTFRSLFVQYLRLGREAYVDAFKLFGAEKAWSTQIRTSFLLQLDYELASEWQQLRDEQAELKALGRHGIKQLKDRQGELTAQLVQLESRRDALESNIATFSVLPEYRNVETRANQLTSLMQELQNEQTMDARSSELYEQQMSALMPKVPVDEVTRLFQEAGVVFGDQVIESLTSVLQFHEAVARNRRSYLESEISLLARRQSSREQQLIAMENEKSQSLQLLQTTGALEDFASLQRRVSAVSIEIEDLRRQIEQLRQFRNAEADVRERQDYLLRRGRRDLDERTEIVTSVIRDFASVTEALYGFPGSLIINVDEGGYRFRTELARDASTGVSSMRIFAYDVSMLSTRLRAGEATPRFLGHDSILFDGVDERQFAQALTLVATRTQELDFQYLVSLNSDAVPRAELARLGMDLDSFVIATLTDHDISGSLLGVSV